MTMAAESLASIAMTDTQGADWVEDRAADWEALRRASRGDDSAFAAIVERHQGRLLRLCERMLGDREEARDAVQEVFVKAYRKAAAYEPRGQLYTWLYRIAVNHCLNLLRRRKIVRFLRLSADPELDGFDAADTRAGPERRLDANRRWGLTRRWLDELPVSQRAVLVLARFEGLSYKEIAAQLEISVPAVESRLFRAMRSLEKKRLQTEAEGSAP